MESIHAKNVRRAWAFAISALLTGCPYQIAPTEGNQSVENTIIPLSPETTYRNLVRAAQAKCFSLTVDAHFYPYAQEADVSFFHSADPSSRFILAVLSMRAEDAGTAVTIRSPGRIKEFFAPSIQWMRGEDARCPTE